MASELECLGGAMDGAYADASNLRDGWLTHGVRAQPWHPEGTLRCPAFLVYVWHAGGPGKVVYRLRGHQLIYAGDVSGG